jgi:exosortase
MTSRQKALAVALLGSFAVLYRNVILKLVSDWSIDENYSHGFLIVPLAAYFAWERRDRLRALPVEPSNIGLLVVLASIALLTFGVLGAEVFTTEVSMIGSLAGSILFLGGWARLRVLLFPLAFLLLMVPLPAIIFNQITFPLQLLASRFGESVLVISQIPVLREGNIIHLANTSLEVAEACSGIRSLITLLTLGIVYGYFMDNRGWVRTGVALTTIPVAILANGLRVAGTGIAAHHYGVAAAEGFFHSFSGWLVFIAAFLMLFLSHRLLVWRFPQSGSTLERPAVMVAGSPTV